ncbi:MAG TPA: DUF4097 family beta strand repeat-containing protein [Gemmatimonadaceae bacterium]|jgi:DUF4097 and DUF4098 domain-containing protein YvlB
MIRSTLAAAGVALVLSSPLAAQQSGRDETTFTWSKQLTAGSQVSIRNLNGPITVRESTDGRVEVRATKVPESRGSVRNVAFDVRETNGGVEICTVSDTDASCRDRNVSSRNVRVRVDYTVLIPASMSVSIGTGNGDVSIARAGADVSASTGNGRVSIGETTGRVDASTGNGDVRVDSANGPVRVTTGNGRVSVTTGTGDVNANSGSGEIDVRMGSLSNAHNMTFNSGSGPIRVTLPADFNGQVDASTGSGSLRSDFAISVVGRLDAQHVRGTIGKGGPLLRLNTGSGMIELLKN